MENNQSEHITKLQNELEFALQRLSNISDEIFYVSHTARYSFLSDEFTLAADAVRTSFVDDAFMDEQTKLDFIATLRRGVTVCEGYGLRFVPRDLEKIMARIEAVPVLESDFST